MDLQRCSCLANAYFSNESMHDPHCVTKTSRLRSVASAANGLTDKPVLTIGLSPAID